MVTFSYNGLIHRAIYSDFFGRVSVICNTKKCKLIEIQRGFHFASFGYLMVSYGR